jgi:hypothetical protein
MESWLTHNRKLIGYVLSLLLLAMALPPRASWQCLNGTPCPANCPMLRSDHVLTAARCSMSSGAAGHCSRCAPVSSVFPIVRAEHGVVCTSQQCVLRYRAQATGSLASKQILTLPLLALPPPVVVIVAPAEPCVPFVAATPVFHLHCFLKPPSDRAPPFRLI